MAADPQPNVAVFDPGFHAASARRASFTILRELLARLEGGRRVERGRLRYVRVASGRLEAEEMDWLECALGVPVVTSNQAVLDAVLRFEAARDGRDRGDRVGPTA